MKNNNRKTRKDVWCTKIIYKSRNNYQNPKRCKDIVWICVFVAFWCCLTVIIALSCFNENINVALNGADSFGNVCGQKHNKPFENFSLSAIDTSKQPYLLFYDHKQIETVVRLCVEQCPGGTLSSIEEFEASEDHFYHFCRYDLNYLRQLFAPTSIDSRLGPCPFTILKSFPVKNRCLPSGSFDLREEHFALLNSIGLVQSFFETIYLTWHYVSALCGLACVVSSILLALMIWMKKIIVWIIGFLAIVINAGLCIELWLVYSKIPSGASAFEKEEVRKPDDHYTSVDPYPLNELQANETVIIFLAILTSFTTIIFIVLVKMWFKDFSQLKLLFEEAAVCIKYLPGLSITPMIAVLTWIVLAVLSSYTLLCIRTSMYPIVEPTKETLLARPGEYDETLRIFQQVKYVDSKPIRRTFWITVIGFIWTTEFIFAFEEFAISAAVSFWYFKTSMKSPSLHAVQVLVKYHLGTIAKGSAIITVLKVPRIVLVLICKRLKEKPNNIWFQRMKLLEGYIGGLNHTAYVPVAMETLDLHSGAAIAWKILAKNALQVESVRNAFAFVLFLSKVLVATLTSLVGLILLKDSSNVYFYMAPVLFSTVCAFCIAHIVFSIFQITADAILLCACEDKLISGGSIRLAKCSLAELFRNAEDEQDADQVIKIKAIHRRPFGGVC